jgi:hypothetical protein
LTIIGNKTALLLHAVLKEIHECTAVRERDGASGRCGGGLLRGANAGMSDVQPGLPTGRDYIRVHRVETVCPGCDHWWQLDLAAPQEW